MAPHTEPQEGGADGQQLGLHGDGGAGVEPEELVRDDDAPEVRPPKYIAMEFRTFIREMILLPCQVIRRARRKTLRIIGWQPSVDRLFSTWNTIERTGFG